VELQDPSEIINSSENNLLLLFLFFSFLLFFFFFFFFNFFFFNFEVVAFVGFVFLMAFASITQ
jgi:hypothetical protein